MLLLGKEMKRKRETKIRRKKEQVTCIRGNKRDRTYTGMNISISLSPHLFPKRDEHLKSIFFPFNYYYYYTYFGNNFHPG